MKQKKSKVNQLKNKPTEAKQIIEVLEKGESDAVVSENREMLLRLKELEKELREREQRYRSFMERSPDAIFYLDANGLIEEVNPSALQLTGFGLKELTGRKWQDLCIPEDRDKFMQYFKACRAGKTIDRQTVIIGKDNQRIYAYLTIGALNEPANKKGLFIIAQDFTKVKRIEEDLRLHQVELETQNEELRRTQDELERTRNRYLDLYEHAPVGYLLLNASGTISDANLTAAKLFGRERSSLIDLRAEKLALTDEHDKLYVHLRNLTTSNGKQRVELRFFGPEESFFWALVETVAFGQDPEVADAFRMTITDITERKLAEQALEEAERKYRELVQFAPAGIYEIDFRKKKFTAVNDVMCRMLGYSRTELLKMNPFAILEAEEQTRFRKRMQNWLAGVKESKNVEYRVKTKDGRSLDVLLEVTFTTDEEGKPLGATVVAHDITERKRAERALERERELLQQIVENIPVMLVTWEPSLKRFTLNRCATGVLGWTNEDANDGDLMRKVYPDPAYRAEVGTFMQSFSPEWREFNATTKTGEKIPSLWNNIRLNDNTMIGIGIDLRELKEAEEKMAQQNSVLQGIARILSETINTETEEELGNVCLKVTEEITNSQIGFIAELNHRSGKLEEITISSQGWDACRMPDKSGHGKKSPAVFDIQGIFGRVLRDGKGFYTNEPSSHPASIGVPKGHPDLSSFLGVPLIQEKRVIGMMGLANCEGGYRQEDLEAAESLSGAIVEALFRKRAEQALIESEKKNRALIRYAPSGIFEVDFHKQRFTAVNDAMCRMVGYSREELLEMSPFDILHESEHGHFEKQIKKWLNEKEPKKILEYKIKSAEGRLVEALLQVSYTRDEDGKPLGAMAVGHDITKRKEAARNLQIQEERLRLAQQAGKVGVFDWNMKTKKVVWSEELEDMFGLPPGGFDGTYERWAKFVLPEDMERVERFLEKWLESDRDEEQWKFRMKRADNDEVRWIEVRARVFRDRKGKPERMIGTNIDFTDTKNTEIELQRLNETLEHRVRERTAEVQQQADQLRALAARLSQTEQQERRRLAQILHDHIQQLIAAARMQMGWLIQDYETNEQKEKAEEADNILKEAMEASRSLAIDLSPPVLFEAGLIGALNWLADRMKAKNDFSVEIIADSKAEPATEEMRSFLFECVRELFFNALKHSGVNEAKVELIRTSDNMIKLIVSDEGQGFDPEEINKRMATSNAFGLFSIKQRLSYWGGQMKLWSVKGDGTKVTLTIPGEKKESEAQDDPAEKNREKDESLSISDKTESCRVLIVDDHKIMREGLVGIFRFETDIEVVGEATDGPQAIKLAEKLQPDVIVMDINLGEMSGVEATKKILEAHPEIKVIGLSMNLDKEVVKAMRNAGACAYLTKDHLSRDLISTIRRCFEE